MTHYYHSKLIKSKMLKAGSGTYSKITGFFRKFCMRTKSNQQSNDHKMQQKLLYSFINELFFQNVPIASVDMGGSLIKLSIFIPNSMDFNQFVNDKFIKFYIPELSLKIKSINGSFIFYKFTYEYFNDLIDLLNSFGFPFKEDIPLRGSGGGIHKYKDQLIEKTKYKYVDIQDELASVMIGLLFMSYLKIPDEMYMNTKGDDDAVPYTDTGLEMYESHVRNLKHVLLDNMTDKQFQRNFKVHKNKRALLNDDIYPLLYVQIGTGIGMLKIDGQNFERVDGTAFGGQSFFVLSQLLNNASKGSEKLTYDDLIKKIHSGLPSNLMMTVGDIYGKDYKDLASDIPAAFCGRYNPDADVDDQIAALHELFCINIAQIACLNARIYGLRRIIFGGSFVTFMSEEYLKIGVAYYSKNQIDCIFTHHDGFLGSIGTLLGAEKTCQQQLKQDNPAILEKVTKVKKTAAATI